MRPTCQFAALCFVFLVCALTTGTAYVALPAAIHIALGLPLAFVFPGFALISAAAPRLDLSLMEQVVAITGTSIACDICCGLVLGATPLGLSPASIALTLGCATAAAVLVAAIRMRRAGYAWFHARQSPKPSHSPALEASPSRYTSWFDPHRWQSWIAILASAGALLLATGAIVASEHSAVSVRGPAFASLSVLQVSTSSIRIQVISHEPDPRTFDVSLKAGTATVAQWFSVPLRPGQSWTRSLSLPAEPVGTKMEVDLFLGQSSQPYERVFLFFG
jgi:hypothetical protein